MTTEVQTIFAWPCGTWCFREDLWEYDNQSDDYVFAQVPTYIDLETIEDMYEFIRKEEWKK